MTPGTLKKIEGHLGRVKAMPLDAIRSEQRGLVASVMFRIRTMGVAAPVTVAEYRTIEELARSAT